MTNEKGEYALRTIVPVPYKDGQDWRPAHIHLRISSANHQDLITQIYFAGDPHIAGDPAAAKSKSRVLSMQTNESGEKEVAFDVVLGQTFALDSAAYAKIVGLYQLDDGMAEFSRKDDILFMKLNGQIMEGLVYKGNNTFEGGLGFNKVRFDFQPDGEVQASIYMWQSWDTGNDTGVEYSGKKVLKY